MGKLRTFQELGGDEKFAAFEAAALLLLARGLVALVPLRIWRRQFGKVTQISQTKDPARRQITRIVRQAIGRAMRNAPLDFICLPQALSARWMLKRRGLDSDLSIGVQRNSSGGLDVHAWLTSGGHWVTGDCEPEDYAPF